MIRPLGRPALALLGALALAALLAPAPVRAQGPGTPELAEPAPLVPVAVPPAGRAAGSLHALPYVFSAEDGSQVRLDHWAGRPLLMAMADSGCRDSCSYTMQRLEELVRAARQRGEPIEVVIVSVDPRVDDARAWTSYRRRHGLTDAHWHFLVGSPPATRAVASLLGLRSWNYAERVMHEFGITLVDASGHVDRVLTWANRDSNLFAAEPPPCLPGDTRGCQP